MNSNDFQRMAPRYFDGSLSDRQLAVITKEVQTSSDARESLDLLERESLWISKAFDPSAEGLTEDLSRVMLRVRRRNPYRKMAIHPALALGVQMVLAISLLVMLFSLNADLLPPDITIASVDGKLSLPLADADGNRELKVGVPIATPKMSQARVSLGGMDDLILSQDTRLSIVPPKDGIRQVVSLEHGEIWTDLRQRDKPMLFTFAHESLKGWQLRADNAQLNAALGKTSPSLMPRNPDAGLAGLAESHDDVSGIVRVMTGKAWLRDPEGKEVALERGKAYVLKESGLTTLNDPDAAVYSRLRLDGERFKLEWDWANPSRFPLSVDGATLPVWNIAMTYAETIEHDRSNALKRDGEDEIRLFRQHITGLLEAVGAPEDDLGRVDEIDTSKFGETLEKLHLPNADGGNPPLLRVLRNFVETEMNRARERNPRDIDVLRTVLLGQNFDAKRDYNLSRSESRRFSHLAREQERLEAITDKASEKLEGHRGIANLDLDGSKRAALKKKIGELSIAIAELESKESVLEEANNARDLVQLQIDGLNDQLDPLVEELEEAEAEIVKHEATIKASPYTPDALDGLVAAESKARESYRLASAELKTKSAALAPFPKQVEAARTESIDSESALGKARQRLEADEESVFKALFALQKRKATAGKYETQLSETKLVRLFGTDEEKAEALTREAELVLALVEAREDVADAQEGLGYALDDSIKAKARADEASLRFEMASKALERVNADHLAAKTAEAAAISDEAMTKDAFSKAENARVAMEDAKTRLERAQRLLKTNQEAVTALNADIAPLVKSLAEEAKKIEFVKETIDDLIKILEPLPQTRRDHKNATNDLKRIQAAIESERRLQIDVVHAAKFEIEKLAATLKQAATLRTVLSGNALELFPVLTKESETFFANLQQVDKIDEQLAGLRSSEVAEREKLLAELYPLLKGAISSYASLADRYQTKTSDVVSGGGAEKSLAELGRRAKARMLAGEWLNFHSKNALLSTHEDLDQRVLRYREEHKSATLQGVDDARMWEAFLLNRATEAAAEAKKEGRPLGVTTKRDTKLDDVTSRALAEALAAHAPLNIRYAELGLILAQEGELRNTKSKRGEAVAHEIAKVEKRNELLDQAIAVRNESPSLFEHDMLAFLVDQGDLTDESKRAKVMQTLWNAFYRGSVLLPSEARGMSEGTRTAKEKETKADYYHEFLIGNRKASGSSIHSIWRSKMREQVSKTSFQQYQWLRDDLKSRIADNKIREE